MPGPYVQVGPFTNLGAPGYSAAWGNGLESMLLQLQGSTGVTTLTGGTNGTCDCYEPLQGAIKVVIIIQKQFRTGGSNQDYVLPVAFTTKGFFWAGDCDTFTFMNGGVGQNVDVITSSGNSSNVGSVTANTFGGITHPFDVIRFSSGAGSNHNSTIIVIGV